jgi:hypothetical protein
MKTGAIILFPGLSGQIGAQVPVTSGQPTPAQAEAFRLILEDAKKSQAPESPGPRPLLEDSPDAVLVLAPFVTRGLRIPKLPAPRREAPAADFF